MYRLNLLRINYGAAVMSGRYRTVLITGASSGMGKGFTEQLLSEGMIVYAAARSIDKMSDLAKAGAIVLKMDITSDDDIVTAVEKIKADHGGVDVLINNAGYGQYGSVEETPVDAARYQFEVNLFGLARLTQLLIPSMREQGKGLIINISSMGGVMYTPLGAWYHATKHALEGWSDCLRFELQPLGIDVVIVQPGLISTGFGDAVGENFIESKNSPYSALIAAIKKGTEETYAAGRFSPPSVITNVILKAIRAKRPRTRYAAGAVGPMAMKIRRIVPDRMFDWILRSQVK
ncbi:MAG: oxidoreductase [Boseongicola sp.]